MDFNKAQLGAIEHTDGAMLVLAGPGSGKTAVITHRTKNLIKKHHVNPSEILVITFTKIKASVDKAYSVKKGRGKVAESASLDQESIIESLFAF